ncbi:hypothetical protein M513_06282 [Trichuris suis]|uniref:Uncharacterized protein n=1 Tax=Trichuris suis TaxID=68888 RepID=A0A085M6E5_9BILA|nr:hypothetical protein M513_06282 [Trichuris suis]
MFPGKTKTAEYPMEYPVTGDEKWIVFDNVKRRKHWVNPIEPTSSIAKPIRMEKKVLLCMVGRGRRLVSRGVAAGSDGYCRPLLHPTYEICGSSAREEVEIWVKPEPTQHGLSGQHFQSLAQVQNWVVQCFGSKPASFYSRGIQLLPERWDRVVDCNGSYFE